MNLIEVLGGYGAAKAEANSPVKLLNFFNYEQLEKELLEYRREKNIFEVGDKVVFKKNWTANDLVLTIGGATQNSIRLDTVLDLKRHFRHATDEEIKVGHRL